MGESKELVKNPTLQSMNQSKMNISSIPSVLRKPSVFMTGNGGEMKSKALARLEQGQLARTDRERRHEKYKVWGISRMSSPGGAQRVQTLPCVWEALISQPHPCM